MVGIEDASVELQVCYHYTQCGEFLTSGTEIRHSAPFCILTCFFPPSMVSLRYVWVEGFDLDGRKGKVSLGSDDGSAHFLILKINSDHRL